MVGFRLALQWVLSFGGSTGEKGRLRGEVRGSRLDEPATAISSQGHC